MKVLSFFKWAMLLTGVAFVAASCGDDDGSDGDDGGGNGDCSNPTYFLTDKTVNGVAVTEVAGIINCDLTLTNDRNWLLSGGVFVGTDDGSVTATLTIEPGTVIWGDREDGIADFLTVSRGSKIMADGTAASPIVFTAFSNEPGSWGGLIINGRGITNTGAEAEGECNSGSYGGTDNSDNSGVLRYVRVEWAGFICATDDELNGITLNAVGSETTIEFVQAFRGADDGIEFFGGAVNVRNAISTGNWDDSFDWTQGWQGNGQFWVVHQNTDRGDRGFEADNNGDNNAATPFSNPTISNVTIVNADDGDGANTGMRLREGTKGKIYNAIVANSPANGVRVSDQQTTDNMEDGSLLVTSTIVFNAGTPWEDADDFASDPLNSTIDPGLNGFIGTVSNNATDPTTLNQWFNAGNYIGAVPSGNNWTSGWAREL